MKNILKSKTALTLTELLVSSSIVIIILLGVLSVDVALRQTQQGVANNAFLVARTSMIMLRLTKDINDATGNTRDPGITHNIDGLPAAYLWIRKEHQNPLTPGDTSDDSWICYDFDGTTLKVCNVAANGQTCSDPAAANEIGLGTLVSFNAQLIEEETLGEKNFYVDVLIVNATDPAAYNEEEPSTTNPVYKLHSQIHPPSMSSVLPDS